MSRSGGSASRRTIALRGSTGASRHDTTSAWSTPWPPRIDPFVHPVVGTARVDIGEPRRDECHRVPGLHQPETLGLAGPQGDLGGDRRCRGVAVGPPKPFGALVILDRADRPCRDHRVGQPSRAQQEVGPVVIRLGRRETLGRDQPVSDRRQGDIPGRRGSVAEHLLRRHANQFESNPEAFSDLRRHVLVERALRPRQTVLELFRADRDGDHPRGLDARKEIRRHGRRSARREGGVRARRRDRWSADLGDGECKDDEERDRDQQAMPRCGPAPSRRRACRGRRDDPRRDHLREQAGVPRVTRRVLAEAALEFGVRDHRASSTWTSLRQCGDAARGDRPSAPAGVTPITRAPRTRGRPCSGGRGPAVGGPEAGRPRTRSTAAS